MVLLYLQSNEHFGTTRCILWKRALKQIISSRDLSVIATFMAHSPVNFNPSRWNKISVCPIEAPSLAPPAADILD
jgi:hypothetical protein